MKYQEVFTGSRSDLAAFVKKMIPELFGGRLSVEGRHVSLPNDRNLEYKLKYEDEESGGSFAFKITWDSGVEEEEEEEKKEETDTD